MPVIIQTQRVLIRSFSAEDETDYLALWGDEQVCVHLPKRTQDETRKIFRDTLADDIAGAVFTKWAIINKVDGHFMGMGLLRYYENQTNILEVGYALHVKYWGLGIATELTTVLIEYAKKHPEITTIVAVTTMDNTPSQRVLEKAGMSRQGNITRGGEELAFYTMGIR